MQVGLVGTGYVGLTTGACLADMGNNVICHDVDASKITTLQAGALPIYEPGLAELVRENQRQGRLRFTTDLGHALAGCQICIITVGTPELADGATDLRYVLAAADGIAAHMQGPLLVALKSTVPVGTTDDVRARIARSLAERNVSFDFDVVFNPEFLKEGMAVEDFMRPDRIIVGVGVGVGIRAGDSSGSGATRDDSIDRMRSLYRAFIRSGRPFMVMDIRSAEMTKLAANVMLASRISMVNELATICEHVGADIDVVRRGIGSDERIGMAYLYPGVGYGGSCFPKDVKALAHTGAALGLPVSMLKAVDAVNAQQRQSMADKIIAHFGGAPQGRHVAVWGLSYKPKTDDVRDAPSLDIIRRLVSASITVCAYDPEAMVSAKKALADSSPPDAVRYASDPYDALRDADALLLATEWGVFRSPDFERIKHLMRESVVFDGRNQYEPAEMRRLGFRYFSVGRPSV